LVLSLLISLPHVQLCVLFPYTTLFRSGFLGGDTQFYGIDVEGSQYFHLPWDTILLINGEVATVNTWGSGDIVPIFEQDGIPGKIDRKSTRLNSSHDQISYAVFCLKKKK